MENIDPNLSIKRLSYSSLLTLHDCPRKFELDRKNVRMEEEDEEAGKDKSLTFAFGHAVGEGITLILEGQSLEDTYLTLFLNWYADTEAVDVKRNKSFYLALAAVKRFHALYTQNAILEGYELVILPSGKAAVELSFLIDIPGGYKFRGFVDAVLQHKETGEILILENKTSSAANINPNNYRNSSQAVGYSVILDVIFPELSSYQVLYLIYKTKAMDYEVFSFAKSYLKRALWIHELLLDTQMISAYLDSGVFPMHGENCVSRYYTECQYLNSCTLKTEYLVSNSIAGKVREEPDYEYKFNLIDLISKQLGD